ncbi:MAG: phosphoribosylformylglycinamidine synthase subunit PurS [Actinobacteria bacterium]|nr:phosphoribosylformylglycinamidine synthase subunit PurS [Cyanobacteriota bacterium]MCL5771573.1 phosphoribosylformylglycinamidine synthase subunit PurS [Actinomycetota bacterium]
MLKVNVYVTLKKEILDAQGLVIKKAIKQIGFDNVNEVRFGKFIQIEINDNNKSEEEIKKEIDYLSDKLLANPNIENYKYEIVRN